MTPEQKQIKCAELIGFERVGPRPRVWHWPEGYLTVSSRPYAELHELPRVLDDANAALELIEHMRKTHHFECYIVNHRSAPFWKASFEQMETETVYYGRSATFSEAVVDAFLKAKQG